MWTIEAFRMDDEELQRRFELAGVGRADLEERLGLADLSVPGVYPLSTEQAMVAIDVFTGCPGLTDQSDLEFFLTAYAD